MGVNMSVTNYGTISQRTAAYVAREMLAHAEPVIVLQKLAQTKPIPQNTADTVKFRRPVPFSANTVPLRRHHADRAVDELRRRLRVSSCNTAGS
jgi:hypothetical protein